jgi:hypothetical protein
VEFIPSDFGTLTFELNEKCKCSRDLMTVRLPSLITQYGQGGGCYFDDQRWAYKVESSVKKSLLFCICSTHVHGITVNTVCMDLVDIIHVIPLQNSNSPFPHFLPSSLPSLTHAGIDRLELDRDSILYNFAVVWKKQRRSKTICTAHKPR